jgi:AI-2 transport protein TqsA
MGNAVGPRVQGRNVALSPLVVLVALAFWAGLGASSGALLAVPLTVALVVWAHVRSCVPGRSCCRTAPDGGARRGDAPEG